MLQVTLQVLGNVKSCLSIGVSVAIFRLGFTCPKISALQNRFLT